MNFEIIEPKEKEKQFVEPTLMKVRTFGDSRGFFYEIFKRSDMDAFGFKDKFVQDNIAYSKKNVLRGLHYQLDPHAQGKYVICLKGEVDDVVVDVRKGSPNFAKHQKFALSGDDVHVLYVPVGFAHGYIVKSDDAFVMYKTTGEYAPNSESGIIWNDKDLNIDWGIKEPILADKDKELKPLHEAENNFEYTA